MAKDKSEQALQLAHQVSREIKALKKELDNYKKIQEQWRKMIEKSVLDNCNKTDENAKKFVEMDKKIIKLHNDQAKTMNEIIAWVKKTQD